jgi:tyrosyl-tRNA synthetase
MHEIEAMQATIAAGANPRDIKFELAEELITRFHDAAAARHAKEDFINRFQKGAMPEEMAEVTLAIDDKVLALPRLLQQAGLVGSTSEALRMIQQGAVRIDGERVEDKKLEIAAGSTHIYQVGKRKFAKVTL